MKNPKSARASQKEVRMKLNNKLVKKFGFEQKFVIKEVLDSVLRKAKPHEFTSLRVLGFRSETEIKKRLHEKQTAISQKKKLQMLNGK
jgi:hypothetical protein